MDAQEFWKGHTDRRILMYALVSRIAILCLQFLSNILIPDHQANVFVYPKSNQTTTIFDNIIYAIFGGFMRWDAQYFMHIALYGYTYENTLAFFPLYPLLLRYICLMMSYIITFLNMESLLLLTSFVINLLLFIKTAQAIFELTALFRTTKVAYTATLLFCFNPASVFFAAPYSESLFCYLTFKSILQSVQLSIKWQDSQDKYLKVFKYLGCTSCIALSALTRSNGILNVIFFIYIYLRVSLYKVFLQKVLSWKFVIYSLLILFGIIIMTLTPFFLVQIYNHYLFCTNFAHNLPDELIYFARKYNLVVWGSFSQNPRPWCYKNIPFAYSYVQDHYWNVGFLKYYEFKQIPNFCLAFPAIYIVTKGVIMFINKHSSLLIHLGILRKPFILYNLINEKEEKDRLKVLLLDVEFALVIHIFFLLVFCILCINVQVTTRMIFSVSPVVYWFCCDMFYSQNTKQKLFIKWYCALYFIVGTIMFCNFLPWT